MGINVAVTGPTGEIGKSAVQALERLPDVQEIVGMARRPFDPAAHGWTNTTYLQGDIRDRKAVDALVDGADVIVHLAFIIMGSREESARVNLEGTRNVFEATVAAARPRRLVYTSSVAAYGYHPDNPVPITEDVPTRGSPEHYYSEQKAACEAALAEITGGSDLELYVLRPCIVAGPKAPALAEAMPWNQMPGPVRRISQALPWLKPPFPDPGTPLQLVHHDDVASAIALAATTSAPPGRLQHRGRRRLVGIADGGGAGCPAGAGARSRRDGRLGGDRQVAVRSVCAGVAARRPHVGGDGHRQGEVAAGLGAEIHCRRDLVGAGGVALALGVLGGPARGGAAFIGPVGSVLGTLRGIAEHVVVGIGRAGIGFHGVGGVLLHDTASTQSQPPRLCSCFIQSLGTLPRGPGTGCAAGWLSGGASRGPS